MNSLVRELQQEAMNPQTQVADLLRKALVVAAKLNIQDFREWISSELNGYKGDGSTIPSYRHLKGELKATHPMYGMIPYVVEDSELADKLTNIPNNQSIGQLESLVKNGKTDGTLVSPLPEGWVQKLDNGNLVLGIVPTRIIGHSQIYGIVEAVRNIVLEWSLKLEADGILGEGLTFSTEERKKAASPTLHIQNFTGIVGDVHSSNLQVGDYNTIHSELKRLGISQADRNELENLLDQLGKAKGQDKASILKRGSEWVLAHAKELGDLAKVLGEYFGSGGGGQLPPSIIT